MADFIIHIQLHESEPKDIQKLHNELRSRGFQNTILYQKKVKELPHNVYFYTGSDSANDILGFAEKSAFVTGRDFSIIVSSADAMEFAGLRELQ